MMYGYSGRMLIVDLTSKQTKIETFSKAFCKNFIGGNGFSIKFLYDYQKPRIEPFSPDNVLIFAVGPFCGTVIPTSAKYIVQAKSPLTGFQGKSIGSSFWSLAFRRAGYDALLIKGRSKKPTYLFIDDDTIAFRDAKELWGKGSWETDRIIRDTVGDDNIQIATIGPAGENLVRFASIISDHHHEDDGRTGMGAVMGSKQLKAVVVRGSKTIEVAKLDELLDSCREFNKKVRKGLTSTIMKDLGTIGTGVEYLSKFATPIRNFQGTDALKESAPMNEDIRKISTEWMQKQYIHKSIACASCPIGCDHVDFIGVGPYKGVAYKIEYQDMYALGTNCGIWYLPAIVKAGQLCDTLGIDVVSTGVVIAWAMECFEKGILTLKDTDGTDLSFGNYEALMGIIPKIAHREGLGDILAEGVKRASEKIGQGSEKFAMHSKGLEFPGFDVRRLKMTALSFAVSTRGADHLSAAVFGPEIRGRVNMYRFERGQGEFVAEKENNLTLYDLLMICKFSGDLWVHIYSDLAHLYTLVTGIPLTSEELRTAGERVWNMEKAYNIREGWTRKDDSLPPRVFNDPIPDGEAKGSHLTKEEFDFMLDDYYAARGWTKEGIPTKKKLTELELNDVAKEIGV
jgi:aldehyde:ferredoxin oxidoreductase